jgi:two-component system, NarL family, response regulator DesR
VVRDARSAAVPIWNAELDPRTERERQILQRAGDGRSSTEIAAEPHLSEGTVRNYLPEAIAKLGTSNRVDVARIARAKGWL